MAPQNTTIKINFSRSSSVRGGSTHVTLELPATERCSADTRQQSYDGLYFEVDSTSTTVVVGSRTTTGIALLSTTGGEKKQWQP